MNSLFKTVTNISDLSDKAQDTHALRAGHIDWDSFDKIFIHNLVQEVSVGVYEPEKQAPQKLIFDVDVWVNTNPSRYERDDINDILSYEVVMDVLRKACAQVGHTHLLEKLAQDICFDILMREEVLRVDVSLQKDSIFGQGENAGVKISRRKSEH